MANGEWRTASGALSIRYSLLATRHSLPAIRQGTQASAEYRGPSHPDAHRLLEGAAHLRRLAVAVPERSEARLEQGILLVLLERDAFDAFFFLEVGQLDA